MKPNDWLHIICERDVGLFSLVQQVVSQIPWATKKNRCPIVHFGSQCAYWTPLGYAGKSTVWEFYFEPLIPERGVSTIPPEIMEKIVSDYPFRPYIDLGGDSIASSDFGNDPSLRGLTLRIPYGWLDPPRRVRVQAGIIIGDFLRPRSYIKEKVDAFVNGRMDDGNVIGVHARGTDAVADESKAFRRRSLVLDNYAKMIDALLKRDPSSRIFVATDEQAALDYFVRTYGDVVLAYDSLRHHGGVVAGRGPTGNLMPAYVTASRDVAARNGEEAVVEFLLLMRCSCLVHNGSSLARTVLLGRPQMQHFNVHLRNTPLLTRLKRSVRYRVRGRVR